MASSEVLHRISQFSKLIRYVLAYAVFAPVIEAFKSSLHALFVMTGCLFVIFVALALIIGFLAIPFSILEVIFGVKAECALTYTYYGVQPSVGKGIAFECLREMRDGSQCSEKVSLLANQVTNCVAGPLESDKFTAEKRGLFDTCCSSVIPNSNEGFWAAVRRNNYVVTMPFWIHNGWTIYFAILPTIIIVSALIAVCISLYGIFRFFSILISSRWHPLLEPYSLSRCEVDEQKINWILCQISDTHQSLFHLYPIEIREDPSLWPRVPLPNGVEINKRLEAIIGRIIALKPAAIALTGDLVDTGNEEEWNLLVKALSPFKNQFTAEQIISVPDNHDICLNEWLTPDAYLWRRKVREFHYESAIRRIKNILPLEDPSIIGFILKPWISWMSIGKTTQFPQKTALRVESIEIDVISLNSIAYSSRHLLSNAVGKFGLQQLDRLSQLLSETTNPVIVLCHHHVGRTPTLPKSIEDFMICAIDSREMLEILCQYNERASAPVLVLHGHRHVQISGVYRSSQGEVSVYGLPSSTMGDCAKGSLDGIVRFARVGLDDKCNWIVRAVEISSE